MWLQLTTQLYSVAAMRPFAVAAFVLLSVWQPVSALQWPIEYVVRARLFQYEEGSRLEQNSTWLNVSRCDAGFTMSSNHTAILTMPHTEGCESEFLQVEEKVSSSHLEVITRPSRPSLNESSLVVHFDCVAAEIDSNDFSMLPLDGTLRAPLHLCVVDPFTYCHVTEICDYIEIVHLYRLLAIKMICEDPKVEITEILACLTMGHLALMLGLCMILFLLIGFILGYLFARFFPLKSDGLAKEPDKTKASSNMLDSPEPHMPESSDSKPDSSVDDSPAGVVAGKGKNRDNEQNERKGDGMDEHMYTTFEVITKDPK